MNCESALRAVLVACCLGVVQAGWFGGKSKAVDQKEATGSFKHVGVPRALGLSSFSIELKVLCFAHTYKHMYTCMQHTAIHTYKHTYTYLSTYVRTYVCTYVPTYIRSTYTHTYTHTYMYEIAMA